MNAYIRTSFSQSEPINANIIEIEDLNLNAIDIELGDISGQGVINETDPTVPAWVKQISQSDITNWNSKQDHLTAGQNIVIDNNVISAINNTYVHTQLIPSNEWTIEHNLGKRPSVTVVDSADNVVIGEVTYIDNYMLKVYFGSGISFSGKAYLN